MGSWEHAGEKVARYQLSERAKRAFWDWLKEGSEPPTHERLDWAHAFVAGYLMAVEKEIKVKGNE